MNLTIIIISFVLILINPPTLLIGIASFISIAASAFLLGLMEVFRVSMTSDALRHKCSSLYKEWIQDKGLKENQMLLLISGCFLIASFPLGIQVLVIMFTVTNIVCLVRYSSYISEKYYEKLQHLKEDLEE